VVGVEGVQTVNYKVGTPIGIAVTTMTLTASRGLVSVSNRGLNRVEETCAMDKSHVTL